MATVAEFTIPSGGFPLGRVFRELSGVTIELERVVPTNAGVFPYFWARGASADVVLDAVSGHEGLRDAKVVDEVDGEVLFRAEWVEDVGGLVGWFVEADVTILDAVGTAAAWTFEVRVDSPAVLSAFQVYCSERDIPMRLVRLRSLAAVVAGDEYGLTREQEEALLAAFDAGYYSDPRETTLAEVAETLGITRQSLSARLRRGYRTLIASTVASRRT